MLWHLKWNKVSSLHGLFGNVTMSLVLWLCDKPRSSFVSLPSDGLSVELLCCISHRCLVSPGILILNFPLWRSLINSFKAWKSILHPTWTLNEAGSVRNQTIANMMFSDGFYIEPWLSAVLHILIHLTLTSFLRTVNFASPLWGGGCRGSSQSLPGGAAADFCLQQHLNGSNAEQENLCLLKTPF